MGCSARPIRLVATDRLDRTHFGSGTSIFQCTDMDTMGSRLHAICNRQISFYTNGRNTKP